MSLCDDRGLFATDKEMARRRSRSCVEGTRKWPEGAAVAALRDIDAVSHKKHLSACRRINQRFLKSGKDTSKTLCTVLRILFLTA